MPSPIVMFAFAGRRPNLEIAFPFYQRIIDENPDVDIDIWNLARHPADSRYLRTLTGRPRINIRNEEYRPPRKASKGQAEVWKHYANRPEYKDSLFVKVDDDCLFYETDAFSDFITSITENPDHLISARVINHGASTFLEPELWQGFQAMRDTLPRDATPHGDETAQLLAVHRSADYADMCHHWFANNWQTATTRKPELVKAESWVSINCIGMTHDMLRAIANQLGQPSPLYIADRTFAPNEKGEAPLIGDEGAANLLPILIDTGFLVGHATFGPQERAATRDKLAEWRRIYADIADQYLT